MSDWYDRGYETTLEEAAEKAGISKHQARKVYAYIASLGLIDYDIEKEIFYDLYGDEEDEE